MRNFNLGLLHVHHDVVADEVEIRPLTRHRNKPVGHFVPLNNVDTEWRIDNMIIRTQKNEQQLSEVTV